MFQVDAYVYLSAKSGCCGSCLSAWPGHEGIDACILVGFLFGSKVRPWYSISILEVFVIPIKHRNDNRVAAISAYLTPCTQRQVCFPLYSASVLMPSVAKADLEYGFSERTELFILITSSSTRALTNARFEVKPRCPEALVLTPAERARGCFFETYWEDGAPWIHYIASAIRGTFHTYAPVCDGIISAQTPS